MVGEGVLDSSRELVSGLCSQPEIETRGDAGNCQGTWRDVSVNQLQEHFYTSFVDMQVWTSLGGGRSKCEERVAKERKLVHGVLQLASKIP